MTGLRPQVRGVQGRRAKECGGKEGRSGGGYYDEGTLNLDGVVSFFFVGNIGWGEGHR